jgi:hypothetical protein
MENTMKKISLSLIIALAPISSAALASSNRNEDLRDTPTYCGEFTKNVENQCGRFEDATNALAIKKLDAGTMSNFERMKKLSEENDNGRH